MLETAIRGLQKLFWKASPENSLQTFQEVKWR